MIVPDATWIEKIGSEQLALDKMRNYTPIFIKSNNVQAIDMQLTIAVAQRPYVSPY
jgi:hypothetical protein